MSAISEFLNSAFSELFYDREPSLGQAQKAPKPDLKLVKEEESKKSFKKRGYESIQESLGPSGSLAEFDRVLAMLESNDSRTKSKGITALATISDDNRVVCIAIFSKNAEARKAALNMVRGKPSLLNVIFMESLFRDTSMAAIEELSAMLDNLEDQKALCTLACNHKDRKVRMKALSSLKDIKWLLEIAYSSRYEDSRWEAIERLKDLRVDVDREDLRHDDTLSVIADQLIQSSISEEEITDDMATLIENVRYLQNFTRGRKNDEFSDIVADNLSAYIGTIKNLATSSRHQRARELAVKASEDDNVLLAEIAQHSEYEDAAQIAVNMLASGMGSKSEPGCLALVASLSEDAEKRSKAVSKLDNVQMLKHIIKHSKFDDSRIGAAHKLASMISNLDDTEALRLVVAYAKESKNRELAERRISELETQEKPAKVEEKKAEKPAERIEKKTESPAEQIRKSEPEQHFSSGGGLWATIKELIGI